MDNSIPPPLSFDYMTSIDMSPIQDNSNNNNSFNNGNNVTSPTHRRASQVDKSMNIHQTTTDDNYDSDSDSGKKKLKPTGNNATILPSSLSSTAMCNSNVQKMVQVPTRLILKTVQNPMVQKLLSIPISIGIFLLVKKIFLHHQSLEYFFTWMERHPNKGMAAYLIIYPFHMLLFLPGTPLVMGAGYIFKIRFGWLWGVSLCSVITLFGSLIGSIMCFLLGRYCMRSSVRRWSKKYPMFDPIDAAVSVNSFKIMALLYLTPVIPLGPLSYVMGTTSMPLMSFAKAKIAALPLTVLYVYLGAATGTLVVASDEGGDGAEKQGQGGSKGMGELKVDPRLIGFGILCSIVSIATISIKMKQELQKILDQQSKDEEIMKLINYDDDSEKVSNGNLANNSISKTRQRVKATRQINGGVEDIELKPLDV